MFVTSANTGAEKSKEDGSTMKWSRWIMMPCKKSLAPGQNRNPYKDERAKKGY